MAEHILRFSQVTEKGPDLGALDMNVLEKTLLPTAASRESRDRGARGHKVPPQVIQPAAGRRSEQPDIGRDDGRVELLALGKEVSIRGAYRADRDCASC
jgi:hypothetical protein